MRIAVPKQPESEPRAPITPAVVKRLTGQGVEVAIEPGVGQVAHITDQQYQEAGAVVLEGGASAWSDADAVVTLSPPTEEQAGAIREGGVLIGMLQPLAHAGLMQKLAERRVTSLAMEFLPRTTRAQAMDVLSSQANIGGYKAVVLGATHCAKMFPMMITAAGTLSPAKVFVIGAGVAGLQAIATAKRLGAVVEAFDVRAATKEQVQSLGGRFIELPTSAQDDKATGGYAKEQTDEERQKQTELMAKHVIGADVVVATAAVFGKAPPLLIPKDVVEKMSPGAVVVDIAASPDHGRGNCELTKPGEMTTTDNGVVVIGTLNLPGTVPTHASQAYANNILNLLGDLIVEEGEGDDKKPTLKINLEDEIQKGACITHDGQVTNDLVKQALQTNTD